jgi:predicted nucleotidyltransferase component of viral defense system
MPNPRVEILTSFQKELLKTFSGTALGKSFFLTGGTALSGHYLFHRLSDDLDLFTEAAESIPHVVPILEKITSEMSCSLRFSRRGATFIEVFVTDSDKKETVKMQFAQDSPYRFMPVCQSPWGIDIDNALDIACNKLGALFGRAEARDFIDVYFIARDLFPYDELVQKAKQKNPGMDDYWLAQAYKQVTKAGNWPRMLVPCSRSDIDRYFEDKARAILDSLKPNSET